MEKLAKLRCLVIATGLVELVLVILGFILEVAALCIVSVFMAVAVAVIVERTLSRMDRK